MTKVMTTCFLGAGIMAAAATLPQSQAHDGHDGHDHATTQQTEPQVPSNRVIEMPPPFETLDNGSPPSSAGSSTRNQLQQPERNWGDPANRRPELRSPRAERGDVNPVPPNAPEAFRRDFGNDVYPESRSPHDFARGRSVPRTEDFGCSLEPRGRCSGDYPSFREDAERTAPGGCCHYETQSLHSSSYARPRDLSPRRSYNLARYQYDNQLSHDYQDTYDCPFARGDIREF